MGKCQSTRNGKDDMTRLYCTAIFALIGALLVSTASFSQPAARTTVVVAVPARAGTVEGKTENSDAFIWQLFTEFTAPASTSAPTPVVFETWASDKDTFSTTPHWPEPNEPLDLHPSVLGAIKTLGLSATASQSNSPLLAILAQPIDAKCNPPSAAAVGGFPLNDCIVEQVARNRPEYDYIVKNHLNTQTGLAAAYAKSMQIDMPTESIAVKGDWVPLPALLQWLPQLRDVANIKKLYHTVTVDNKEYALVSMHVASRQNQNWVWGTFEHQMNPGRCDYIGCFDTFGAQLPEVAPNKKAYNTQYGACLKTPKLKAMMAHAKLSPVWENYCLKSTEVDFVAPDGTPYALGNSVIEGIVGGGTVAASSCITCHYYASFGPNGTPTANATSMLPFNATGNPIPGVLTGARQFSFNWGVRLAPK
jgi:hypothetical protein